jgi:hypothetical protein
MIRSVRVLEFQTLHSYVDYKACHSSGYSPLAPRLRDMD